MRGLPASGKSTKAKLLLEHGNTVRINKDLLRTMLHFDVFNYKKEEQTQDASRLLTEFYLTQGINVIIDDTNLNPKVVAQYVEIAERTKAKIEYVDTTDVSVDECVSRDVLRSLQQEKVRSVGGMVIKKMALQYMNYMAGENVVVCDLDGTLCNIEHRLKYGKGEEKNWKTFFELIPGDSLRADVLEKLRETAKTTDSKIVLVSARPEDHRFQTELWLGKHGIQYDLLLMRQSNDKRPDTEVKLEIYNKYLSKMKIWKVFDDRPSVIRMWRELGLLVEDVGAGIEF